MRTNSIPFFPFASSFHCDRSSIIERLMHERNLAMALPHSCSRHRRRRILRFSPSLKIQDLQISLRSFLFSEKTCETIFHHLFVTEQLRVQYMLTSLYCIQYLHLIQLARIFKSTISSVLLEATIPRRGPSIATARIEYR